MSSPVREEALVLVMVRRPGADGPFQLGVGGTGKGEANALAGNTEW